MSKKSKLLQRLLSRPKDFTWDEATKLMAACGFELLPARGGGSGRMFVHRDKKQKVRLHEPHPRKELLLYMLDQIIEGLTAVGEIEK